jgi:hypothetical protein
MAGIDERFAKLERELAELRELAAELAAELLRITSAAA